MSLSCDPSYDFSIDGHSLTIIEADGGSTFPKTVDRLTILAGQRYSVIVRFVFLNATENDVLLICMKLNANQKRDNYCKHSNNSYSLYHLPPLLQGSAQTLTLDRRDSRMV